jgi:hypothetical protein
MAIMLKKLYDALLATSMSMNSDSDINPEIDISTPELKCEARLMQAYLLHVSCGGTPKSFIAKAQDMAEQIERVLADVP